MVSAHTSRTYLLSQWNWPQSILHGKKKNLKRFWLDSSLTVLHFGDQYISLYKGLRAYRLSGSMLTDRCGYLFIYRGILFTCAFSMARSTAIIHSTVSSREKYLLSWRLLLLKRTDAYLSTPRTYKYIFLVTHCELYYKVWKILFRTNRYKVFAVLYTIFGIIFNLLRKVKKMRSRFWSFNHPIWKRDWKYVNLRVQKSVVLYFFS